MVTEWFQDTTKAALTPRVNLVNKYFRNISEITLAHTLYAAQYSEISSFLTVLQHSK